MWGAIPTLLITSPWYIASLSTGNILLMILFCQLSSWVTLPYIVYHPDFEMGRYLIRMPVAEHPVFCRTIVVFQINQPTRCNNLSSLLLDVYVRLNMFRAPLCPSSGAQQLHKQPLVLPLERDGSRAVGPTTLLPPRSNG
jgi:hypothetical protein